MSLSNASKMARSITSHSSTSKPTISKSCLMHTSSLLPTKDPPRSRYSQCQRRYWITDQHSTHSSQLLKTWELGTPSSHLGPASPGSRRRLLSQTQSNRQTEAAANFRRLDIFRRPILLRRQKSTTVFRLKLQTSRCHWWRIMVWRLNNHARMKSIDDGLEDMRLWASIWDDLIFFMVWLQEMGFQRHGGCIDEWMVIMAASEILQDRTNAFLYLVAEPQCMVFHPKKTLISMNQLNDIFSPLSMNHTLINYTLDESLDENK